MSIGIAIIGAGIFAHEEHLPAVKACPLLSLKAIYSRSKQSADKLAKIAENDVDIYFDAPGIKGRSLIDLLDRQDIDAVIIALPITVQPDFIKEAIAAGKHVLSEKPIAKDLQTAAELLEWYEENNNQKLWGVAENYRFMDQLNFAAEVIRKLNADVISFSLRLHGFIRVDDKYYQAEWRKSPKYSGGCLLDCGIHFVAAIRYLLLAGEAHITQVAAFTSSLQPRLIPLDTVDATMKISNGKHGTFSLSFGAEHQSAWEMQVVTDRGTVRVTPTEVSLMLKGEKAQKALFRPNYGHGVEREVEAFAKCILSGKMDQRASPEEAYRDLLVMQALLDSGAAGGKVKMLG